MLAGQGIAVTDARKRFRPFMDIIWELSSVIEHWDDQKRGAFLLKTFGTEALLGITAIMTQLTNGVKTNSGELVRGPAYRVSPSTKSLRPWTSSWKCFAVCGTRSRCRTGGTDERTGDSLSER